MTNDTIKLDLPLVPGVLKRAAAMLLGVADDLSAAPRIDPEKEKAAAEITDAMGITTAAPGADVDTTTVGFGAVVPAPPPPPADDPPPAVTLDKDELPWDNRIHGSGKTFLKTGARAGCWKYARNLEEGLVEKVEAELKAAMAAAPPAPGADTDTKVPPPPPAPDAMDFPEIVQKVTGLVNAGQLTADQVTAVLAPMGLASLSLVASRPDLIPSINTEIDKLCPPTP